MSESEETKQTLPKSSGLDALEPWRQEPCRCVHCGKLFSGEHPYASKNAHLGHCKKRILSRYLKVGKFLFVLRWNPLKSRALAFEKMTHDFEDKGDTLPQLVVGACEFLKNSGILKDYTITELNKSEQMIAYPNGWVSYPLIRKMVVTDELADFEGTAKELANRKYNTEEKQTTETKRSN